MKTYSLAAARQNLSSVVADVAGHHEHVLITKNGEPAAVVISADEWAEIEETEFWRSQPRIRDKIEKAREEIAAGRFYSADDLRAELRKKS